MEVRLNCWEYKQCGREPLGNKVIELGVCPAATTVSFHKANHGRNAGRACWCVPRTLCGSKSQVSAADRLTLCKSCDFFELVKQEEGTWFELQPPEDLERRLRGL